MTHGCIIMLLKCCRYFSLVLLDAPPIVFNSVLRCVIRRFRRKQNKNPGQKKKNIKQNEKIDCSLTKSVYLYTYTRN